jgi:NAD(P)H-dependent nitrite reductase small subunit
MADWHRVASADEIAEGQAYPATVAGTAIAVYRVEGALYAIGNICPHQGDVLLSDGFVDGDRVECPMHQSCFEIRTGKVLGPPAQDDVAAYPVKVEDGAVFVRV